MKNETQRKCYPTKYKVTHFWLLLATSGYKNTKTCNEGKKSQPSMWLSAVTPITQKYKTHRNRTTDNELAKSQKCSNSAQWGDGLKINNKQQKHANSLTKSQSITIALWRLTQEQK